jgi:hypothetical protein
MREEFKEVEVSQHVSLALNCIFTHTIRHLFIIFDLHLYLDK